MEQSETIVRSDRASNQVLIVNALAEFKTANKRLPTQDELAARTGLSRTTVQRRLRDIDFGEAVAPLRLYLQDVLLTIAEKALEGNMRAAKLYLQVGWGWSEKDPMKLLPEKPKDRAEYMALYEGRKYIELSRTEWEEVNVLFNEGRATIIGELIVDTNDPRYREEIHERYRASLEKDLDDGMLESLLSEMGYRLEPLNSPANPARTSRTKAVPLPSVTISS